MPVSQADIDALNVAIASGEKQVVLDGQSITYRSVAELVAARKDLQDQMNTTAVKATGTPRRPKQYGLYVCNRGFHNE